MTRDQSRILTTWLRETDAGTVIARAFENRTGIPGTTMNQGTLFDDSSDGTCPECGGPVEVIDLDTVGQCSRCGETLWQRRPRDRWQPTAKYFGVDRGTKRPKRRARKAS